MDDASSFSNTPMPEEMGNAEMPEEPMDMEQPTEQPQDDELINLINGLNDDHRHAVKKYAESMANQEGEENSGEEAQEPEMPMQESVKFTKGQLNKINQKLKK